MIRSSSARSYWLIILPVSSSRKSSDDCATKSMPQTECDHQLKSVTMGTLHRHSVPTCCQENLRLYCGTARSTQPSAILFLAASAQVLALSLLRDMLCCGQNCDDGQPFCMKKSRLCAPHPPWSWKFLIMQAMA